MTENTTEMTEKVMNCSNCKKVTGTEEPVFVKKSEKGNRYYLQAICADCKKKKSRPVAEKEFKCLPKELRKEIKNLDNGDEYALDSNNGGLLPLLPLLGAIFSGVAAASTATGAIANTVISKKKADEEKRHNEEKEKIMREAAKQGSGLNSDKEQKQEQEEETPRNHRSESAKILRYSKYLETHLSKVEQIKKAKTLLESCGFTISMEISSDSGAD